VLDVRGAAPTAAAPAPAPAPAPGPVPTASTAPPATEAVQAPKATDAATLEKGFEAGARLFVGIPFGEAFADSAMSDMSAAAFGLWLDASYRLNPHLSLGGYLTYAVAGAAGSSASTCDAGGFDCSRSQLRLGLQGQYYFTPEEPRSGWVGAGIGYEWMTSTVDDKALSQTFELKISGPELLLLQGGYDWQLAHFRFGPTAALGLGRFTSVKLDQTTAGVTNSATPDPEDAFHGWFFLGVRATILIGG
jgi:Autotransporter beta-domain